MSGTNGTTLNGHKANGHANGHGSANRIADALAALLAAGGADGASVQPDRSAVETDRNGEAKTEDKANRDPKGRFGRGNRAAAKNKNRRRRAALQQAFAWSIDRDSMAELGVNLMALAKAGNLEAARLVMEYVIGKPLAAPDPDRLDLDEMQLAIESPRIVDLCIAMIRKAAISEDVLAMLREGKVDDAFSTLQNFVVHNKLWFRDGIGLLDNGK